MRILAFCPFTLDTVGGNVVTLKRVREELGRRGHTMEIYSVNPRMNEEDIQEVVSSSKPDLLHFYHAFKTGIFLPSFPGIPSVVTLSGTDVAHDLGEADRRRVIKAAMNGAGAVLTYNQSHAIRIRTLFPEVTSKIAVLPKGVTLGTDPFDPGIEGFLFFHPGGIRPVKNNLFAVESVSSLGSEAHLLVAGPVLDEKYGEQFRDRISSFQRGHYQERIPHEAMGTAYARADVVLNTSLSEGISNALIEAMVAGRPILASDVPGNRDLIESGKTGILYHSAEDFQVQAKRLEEEDSLRRDLGAAARAHALKTFSTEREVDALLAAYQAALS